MPCGWKPSLGFVPQGRNRRPVLEARAARVGCTRGRMILPRCTVSQHRQVLAQRPWSFTAGIFCCFRPALGRDHEAQLTGASSDGLLHPQVPGLDECDEMRSSKASKPPSHAARRRLPGGRYREVSTLAHHLPL